MWTTLAPRLLASLRKGVRWLFVERLLIPQRRI